MILRHHIFFRGRVCQNHGSYSSSFLVHKTIPNFSAIQQAAGGEVIFDNVVVGQWQSRARSRKVELSPLEV